LEGLEIDFHPDTNEPDYLPFYEKMEKARSLSLAAIKRAQKEGIPWVLFTHGHSTSRIGATTYRSVVRGLMRSKDATPYIIRKNCIQHYSVFVAAIRL
jgi:hypothetical protein